jgi:hypothetical protein
LGQKDGKDEETHNAGKDDRQYTGELFLGVSPLLLIDSGHVCQQCHVEWNEKFFFTLEIPRVTWDAKNENQE